MRPEKPEITIDHGKKTNTVKIRGELNYFHMSELRDVLRDELVKNPVSNFIFDLDDCDFVDSGCMGLMVEFKKELEKRGSNMKIINVPILVEEAMRRIGMNMIVSITGKK